MSGLPNASLGRNISSGGSVEDTSKSTALPSPTSTKGRKRRVRKVDSSPGSADDRHDTYKDKRRQPGVRRACNECRQQKVGPSWQNLRKSYLTSRFCEAQKKKDKKVGIEEGHVETDLSSVAVSALARGHVDWSTIA